MGKTEIKRLGIGIPSFHYSIIPTFQDARTSNSNTDESEPQILRRYELQGVLLPFRVMKDDFLSPGPEILIHGAVEGYSFS